MKLYEGMFLVDNSEARKDYDAVNQNIASIITKYGGEIKRSERWAERKLAYPIKRRDRGIYILVYFDAPPEAIREIRRDCVIDEVILRTMILRAGPMSETAPLAETEQKELEQDSGPEGAEAAVEEADTDMAPEEMKEPEEKAPDAETAGNGEVPPAEDSEELKEKADMSEEKAESDSSDENEAESDSSDEKEAGGVSESS